VVPRTTLADLDYVDLELRIFRGHFVQFWPALDPAFVPAQFVAINVGDVGQLHLAADGTRDVRVLTMKLRGTQEIRVGVAHIGHGRPAGEHRSERRPPGQSVVNDRSPHARQVTTELLTTGDPTGH